MSDAICIAGAMTCLAYAVYMLSRPTRRAPVSVRAAMGAFACVVISSCGGWYLAAVTGELPAAALAGGVAVAALATLGWLVLTSPGTRPDFGGGNGPGRGPDHPPPEPEPGGNPVDVDWAAFDRDRATYERDRTLTHA